MNVIKDQSETSEKGFIHSQLALLYKSLQVFLLSIAENTLE